MVRVRHQLVSEDLGFLPERLLYHSAAFGALLTLYGVLLFVPEKATTTEVLIWGVLPLIGFGMLAAPFMARRLPHASTVVALAVLGLALRLSLGVFMYSQVLNHGEFGSLFIKDDRHFFDWAIRILSAPSITDGIRTAIQGNPTQIGPVLFDMIGIAVFGPDPRNVVALASIVGALTVILTYRCALYFVPPRWGLLAAFFMAIYPQQVYLAAAIQRDFILVFGFLLAGYSLLRTRAYLARGVFPTLPCVLLIGSVSLVTAWRFLFGVALMMILFAYFYYSFPRLRLGTAVTSVIAMSVILLLGTRLVRHEVLDVILTNPFAGIDGSRTSKLAEAQTFGFLQNAVGPQRFFMLPVTFVLAVIFGFGTYQNLPNNDIVSIGFAWLWLPLVVPMALGAWNAVRRRYRDWLLLWLIPLVILSMSALAYQGLVPRYRAAVEPYMIILGVIGLRQMGTWLRPYWIAVSLFCICFLWHVWLNSVSEPLLLVCTTITVYGLTGLLIGAISARRDVPSSCSTVWGGCGGQGDTDFGQDLCENSGRILRDGHTLA